jgi:PAS domain S-box-containing protein
MKSETQLPTTHQISPLFRQLPLLPVPLAILAIAALRIAHLQIVFHHSTFFLSIQLCAGILGIVFIVIPAARSFLMNKQPTFLMIGCGVLVSQIGATVFGFEFSRSVNVGFTIYNTSVLVSALCHFIGVLTIVRRKTLLRRSVSWLAVMYSASIAASGLIVWVAFMGQLPVFYVNYHGGTIVRSVIVGTASALFLATGCLLWRNYLRTKSPFLYWYSLGLILLSIGLAGSMMIVLWDSPLQWVTRFTQICGLAYMVVAVLASARKTGAWLIPGDFSLAKAGPHVRMLFDTMTEGLANHEIVYDGQGKAVDYVITDVNPAFAKITGLARNITIGKKATELYATADPPYLEIYARVATGRVPEHFETFFPPMGKHFDISVFSPEKGKFATVFSDITGRKHAETAMRESEQRLRYHTQNSPLAVVEWNADYVVIQWSKEAERIFGWSAAETLGKRIDSLKMIHEEDIPIVNKTMERLSSGKESVVVSANRNYTKSGAVIDCVWYNSVLVNDKGIMTSTMSLVQDITAQKQSKEERERLLAEVEKRAAELEATISSTATGLIVYTMAGKAIRMNDIAKELLPQEIFFSSTVEERARILHWETEDGQPFPPEKIPVARALHGDTTHNVVMAAAFPDHKRWISASAAPICTPDGRRLGVVASFVDITPLKKVEEQLKQKTKELQKSNNELQFFNTVMVDREIRMIEMKKEINEFCTMLGKPARYDTFAK